MVMGASVQACLRVCWDVGRLKPGEGNSDSLCYLEVGMDFFKITMEKMGFVLES